MEIVVLFYTRMDVWKGTRGVTGSLAHRSAREWASEQRKQEIYGSKIFSPFLVIIRSGADVRRWRGKISFPSLPTTKIYPSCQRHGWFELNLVWVMEAKKMLGIVVTLHPGKCERSSLRLIVQTSPTNQESYGSNGTETGSAIEELNFWTTNMLKTDVWFLIPLECATVAI